MQAADVPGSVVTGGYSAAAGRSEAGIYAGILLFDVAGGDHQPEIGRVAPPVERRLVLARRQGNLWRHEILATAQRFGGPVCPKQRTTGPVVAWTERDDRGWKLRVHRDGKTWTVASSEQTLRNPLIALSRGKLVVGCEADDGRTPTICLYEEEGRPLLCLPGRHGKLAAGGQELFLLAERDSENAVWLEASELHGGKVLRTAAVRGPLDYTFNADLAVDPATGAALIAAECAVGFGADCQLGLHREIRVWRLAADAGQAMPFPDDTHAALPVEKRAFKTGMGSSSENMPAIRPIIAIDQGCPLVAFRQFRCRAQKDFGWDVWCAGFDGKKWRSPARLTEQVGPPDSGYALLPDGGGLVGVLPELENSGRATASYDHRVAMVAVAGDGGRSALPLPDKQQGGVYRIPSRCHDIALQAPALKQGPREFTLLWGDLHAHTTYSKCEGAANGMPDEAIRYQRDVLRLDVISLLEHTPRMSPTECAWTFDRLEAEAGNERILFYGTEPSMRTGRHTNLYASSRRQFDRLCSLFRYASGRGQEGFDRAPSYAACLDAFPDGQVVALRHFHGDTATDDKESGRSFSPRLEVAMEAMQGRTNNLLGSGGKAGFPAIYLNHGFKIGLVGGTDHFRETDFTNHYCLTGFWVKERSAAGLWEALRNRRTLAVSNAKIAIWATVSGHTMGEEVAANGAVRFNVSVASARPVRRVTMIRDGEVLPWTAVNAATATLELRDDPAPGRHWYVVTAEADSAYAEAAIGHASPFFVTVKR